MEMNYFKKTGKMMVAACMLAGLPLLFTSHLLMQMN